MVGGGVGARGLLLHVIDFECQYRQAVDGPGRALGVDGGLRQRLDAGIARAQVGVDFLDQVGAVLVALVDAALQGQGSHGVDVGVAYDVLQMPLHGVDPGLGTQVVLDSALRIGVVQRGIDVVGDVIACYRVVEYLVASVYKCHDFIVWVWCKGTLNCPQYQKKH